jgi:hypothetical protein
VLALLDVAHLELPVLLRAFDPGQEAPLLLGPRDVQEELADDVAVARQVALVRGDVLERVLPDPLVDQPRRDVLPARMSGWTRTISTSS